MMLRGIVAGVCLLPPTFLMGATLPAVSRWVESTPEGVSWIGLLYGGNIAGAVVGSLVSGFYLLRFYNVATTTYVAVAVNAGVALLSVLIARAIPYEPAVASESEVARGESAHRTALGTWLVYVTIALSGMTALAAEVIWTRLLSLLFGATVYAFALILAVFLLGLGIGAGFGSSLARRLERPRAALGWCQILLCGAMAWTAYQLASSLPYWPINAGLGPPLLGCGCSLILCAASGPCCLPRFSGAPAFRWRWRLRPRASKSRPRRRQAPPRIKDSW